MKLIVDKILVIALFSLGAFANAQPGPPCEPNCPPGPPDGSIDDNLILLFVIALFFGLYTIYKYRFKTKASV